MPEGEPRIGLSQGEFVADGFVEAQQDVAADDRCAQEAWRLVVESEIGGEAAGRGVWVFGDVAEAVGRDADLDGLVALVRCGVGCRVEAGVVWALGKVA